MVPRASAPSAVALPRGSLAATGVDSRLLWPRRSPTSQNVLDSVTSPADLREAGYRIHRLTGDRKGAHAIEIAGAWRVVFRFKDGNAHDVEVVD